MGRPPGGVQEWERKLGSVTSGVAGGNTDTPVEGIAPDLPKGAAWLRKHHPVFVTGPAKCGDPGLSTPGRLQAFSPRHRLFSRGTNRPLLNRG